MAGRVSGSVAGGAPDLARVQRSGEIARVSRPDVGPEGRGSTGGALKDAVVLKLTISGSGHDLWSTYKGQPNTWGARKKGGPTRYERGKGGDASKPVTELAYAGPGGSEAKGFSPKGIWTRARTALRS